MPPTDEIVSMLLWAILPALASAGIVMAVVSLIGGAKHWPAASAVAIVVGVILGQWLRAASPLLSADNPWPSFTTLTNALTLTCGESAWNRLPWAILGALCVERIAHAVDLSAGDGWFLRGAASFAISWWIIPETTRDEIPWLPLALAGAMALQWIILEYSAAKPPDGSAALCMALAFFATGGVLLYAGIARWMELSVVCGSALIGIGAIALWLRADTSGAMPVFAVLQPALLLMGSRETVVETLPWYAFSLAAAAPVTLVAAWPLREKPGVANYLLRLALVLMPLIGAVALAHVAAGPLEFGAAPEADW